MNLIYQFSNILRREMSMNKELITHTETGYKISNTTNLFSFIFSILILLIIKQKFFPLFILTSIIYIPNPESVSVPTS